MNNLSHLKKIILTDIFNESFEVIVNPNRLIYNSHEKIPNHFLDQKIISFQKVHKQGKSRKYIVTNGITLREFLSKNELFTYEINYTGKSMILYLECGFILINHSNAWKAHFE